MWYLLQGVLVQAVPGQLLLLRMQVALLGAVAACAAAQRAQMPRHHQLADAEPDGVPHALTDAKPDAEPHSGANASADSGADAEPDTKPNTSADARADSVPNASAYDGTHAEPYVQPNREADTSTDTAPVRQWCPRVRQDAVWHLLQGMLV